jgi:hypothetical protein
MAGLFFDILIDFRKMNPKVLPALCTSTCELRTAMFVFSKK